MPDTPTSPSSSRSPPTVLPAPLPLSAPQALTHLLQNAPGLVLLEGRSSLFPKIVLQLEPDFDKFMPLFLRKYPMRTVDICSQNLAVLQRAGVRTLYLQATVHAIDRMAFQQGIEDFYADTAYNLPAALIQSMRLALTPPVSSSSLIGEARFPAIALLIAQAKQYGIRVRVIESLAQGLDDIQQHPPGDKYVVLPGGDSTPVPLPRLRDAGLHTVMIEEDPSLPPHEWLIRRQGDAAAISAYARNLPTTSAAHDVLAQRLTIEGTFAILPGNNAKTFTLVYNSPRRDTLEEARIELRDDGGLYLVSPDLAAAFPAGLQARFGALDLYRFTSLTDLSVTLELALDMMKVPGGPADRPDIFAGVTIPEALAEWLVSMRYLGSADTAHALQYLEQRQAEFNQSARATLRDRPPRARPALPDIASEASASEIIQQLSADVPVVVVGEMHDDIWGKKFIIDNLPEFARQSFQRLYLENLPCEMQRDIDRYVLGGQLSARLGSHLAANDQSERRYGFRALLEQARALRMRVIATDNVFSFSEILHDEHGKSVRWHSADLNAVRARLFMQNYLAQSIINREQQAPQAGKGLGLEGMAHVGSKAGIPGLAELTGGRSLGFQTVAAGGVRRNPGYILVRAHNRLQWLSSDYAIDLPPHEMTAQRLEAWLSEVGDFMFYHEQDLTPTLAYRTPERQIATLVVQIDPQTRQFYLEQPLWREVDIDQRRYDELGALSTALNQKLRMTPVQYPLAQQEYAAQDDPLDLTLRQWRYLAEALNGREESTVESALLNSDDFLLLERPEHNSIELHYRDDDKLHQTLLLQRDGDRVYLAQPDWAEAGIHLQRYRNEGALAFELVSLLNMKAVSLPETTFVKVGTDDKVPRQRVSVQRSWARLLLQEPALPGDDAPQVQNAWRQGWEGWQQVLAELNLSAASTDSLKYYLASFAPRLSTRRSAALVRAIQEQQAAWRRQLAATGASQVKSIVYTQARQVREFTYSVPRALRELSFRTVVPRALTAHLAATYLLATRAPAQPQVLERYLRTLSDAIISPTRSAAQSVLLDGLVEWSFNPVEEHFGTSRPQTGLDAAAVLGRLQQAGQPSAYLLRCGGQRLVLGVDPASSDTRYTLIDPQNGVAEFTQAESLQGVLAQFAGGQTLLLQAYRPDLAERPLFDSDDGEDESDAGSDSESESERLPRLKLRHLADAEVLTQHGIKSVDDFENKFSRTTGYLEALITQQKAGTRYHQQVTLQIGNDERVQTAARYLHGKHRTIAGRLLAYTPGSGQVEVLRSHDSVPIDEDSRISVVMHGGDISAKQLVDVLVRLIPQEETLGRLTLVGCALQLEPEQREGALPAGWVLDVLTQLKARQRSVQSISVHTGLVQVDEYGRKWGAQTAADADPQWGKQQGGKLQIWPTYDGRFLFRQVESDPHLLRILDAGRVHVSGALELGPVPRLGATPAHGGAFPLLRQRLWIERIGAQLNRAVEALQKGAGASPDGVPLLHTLQAEGDGAWSMAFYRDGNAGDIVRYQSREPALVRELAQLKGFFEQLNVRRPQPGSALTDEGAVDGLNFAFAIQTLVAWFNRRTRQLVGTEGGEALNPHLLLAIQVHDYVNLAQIGHGVLLDSSQIVRLVRTLQQGESLAHAGFGQLFAKGGVVLQLASVVLDGYELSQAKTPAEKALFGTQLAFDSTGLALAGAGLIGVEVATPIGVIFAGLGIGVTELVRIFSSIAERAAAIGQYMWQLKEAHRLGGFSYHADSKTLLPHAYAVISEIDLARGRIGFDSAQIYPSSHGDSDGIIAHVIGWAAKRPHIVYDKTRLLNIVDEQGWAREADLHALVPDAQHAEILVLPGTPRAILGYDYNLLAGAISRNDAGFAEWDHLAQTRHGPFAFRFLCGFEYIIDKLKFSYRPTALSVTLNTHIRVIVMPELPKELQGYRCITLRATVAGDYTVALRAGSELVLADTPPGSRWIFDAGQLADDQVQFNGNRQLTIGGVRIRIDSSALAQVTLVNRQKETLAIDLTAQRSSVMAMDVRQWQTPEALRQHLESLSNAHHLGARYVVLENYALPDKPAQQVQAYYDSERRETYYIKEQPQAELLFTAGERVYFQTVEQPDYDSPRGIERPLQHHKIYALDATSRQVQSIYQIISRYEDTPEYQAANQKDRDALSRFWSLRLWQAGGVVFLCANYSASTSNQPVFRLEGDRLVLSQLTHAEPILLRLLQKGDSLAVNKLRSALESRLAWGRDTLQGKTAELPSSGMLLIDEHDADDGHFLRRFWLQMPDDSSAAVRVLSLAPSLDQAPWQVPPDIQWVNPHSVGRFIFYSPSAQQLYVQGQRQAVTAHRVQLPGKIQSLSRPQTQLCITLDSGLIYQLSAEGQPLLIAVSGQWRKPRARSWWRELGQLAAGSTLSIMDVQDEAGKVVPAWWIDGKLAIGIGLAAASTELAGVDDDHCSVWLYDRDTDRLYRQPFADDAALTRAFGAEASNLAHLPRQSETIEGATAKLLPASTQP